MTDRLVLVLPVPPSANHMWRHGRRGRAWRSKGYEDWAMLCRLAAGPLAARRVGTPCRVTLTVRGGQGWPRSRDLDNAIKPAVDLLRHWGVIPEDTCEHVVEVRARYEPGEGPAWCELVVESVGEGGGG